MNSVYGCQLTFLTQQGRTFNGERQTDWILNKAASLQILGVTVTASVEGVGRDGQHHLVNMFDFSEQPMQATFLLDEQADDGLLSLVHAVTPGKLDLLYMKIPFEFGTLQNWTTRP